MYPYFVLGYLYNKSNLSSIITAKNFNKSSVLILLGILFVVMLCFYQKDMYIYTTGHCICDHIAYQLYVDLYRYVVGLVGSIFVLLLIYRISEHPIIKKTLKPNGAIAYIGKNTMAIYVISTFINLYILKRISYTALGFPIVFVETFCVLVLCLLINYVIGKNKLLKRLLLGAKA